MAVICLATKLHIKDHVLQLTQPVHHPATWASAINEDRILPVLLQKLAFDPYPDEVRILAIVDDPLRNLLLIGQAGSAAIHLAPDPTVAIAAEAFPEATVIAGWVAAHQPQNLGLLVGECALRCLPEENAVRRLFSQVGAAVLNEPRRFGQFRMQDAWARLGTRLGE